MKKITLFLMTLTSLAFAVPAVAAKPYKNLEVLADNGKPLKKGMKSLTKGLGIKCKKCHQGGKFHLESNKLKEETRPFFKAVAENKDAKAVDAAIADLLKQLEIKEAKDMAKIKKGIALFKKKTD